MVKKNRLKEIILSAGAFVSIVFLDTTINNCLIRNNYLIPILVFVAFITLGYLFLKKNSAQENMKIIGASLLMCILMFSLYMFSRFSIPLIKNSLGDSFGLNPLQFGKFVSLYSGGYGIGQLLGGYFLSKFGSKSYPFLMGIGGVIVFLSSFLTNFQFILISRFLIGIFYSVGCIGIYKFISEIVVPKLFSAVSQSVLFIGILLAVIVGRILSSKFPLGCEWSILTKIQGIVIIIAAIITFIIFLNVKIMESETNNKKNEKSFNFFQALKFFFTNRTLLMLFLISLFVVPLNYFLNTGRMTPLISELFPLHSFSSGFFENIINTGLSYAFILTPILLRLMDFKIIMLGLSLIQVFGVGAFFMFSSTSVMFAYVAAMSIGLGASAHGICPMFIGSEYSNDSRNGLFFGLLNFAAMFLGCTISQFFGEKLLNMFWVKGGSVTNSSGAAIINNAQIFPIVKIMYIVTILGAICCFLIIQFNKKPKQSSVSDSN